MITGANKGIGLATVTAILDVNILGVKRVCDIFVPLIEPAGRVVNVSSASGPNFVSQCSHQRQSFFQDSTLEWADLEALIKEVLYLAGDEQKFRALGLDETNVYGFSKACASLYTLLLAQDHPDLRINACTPGSPEYTGS